MDQADAANAQFGNPMRRADSLYSELRHAIVHGDLRPNQRLVEEDLAEALNVSRTPVREVLQRLTLDGLVVRRRRGWAVREHNTEEIRDIYACRTALEGYAARLAALTSSDEQLAQMESILYSAEPGAISRDQMVDINERFHEAIIDACGNAMLADLCWRSRLYYFNRRVAELYTDEEALYSRAQHERMLAALHARDPDRAERIARQHVESALGVILASGEFRSPGPSKLVPRA